MISIFIPTYNGEKHLAQTLDSVLGQTYRDIEVLCVDDGSSDGTISIIENYHQKDRRIQLFKKKHDGTVPPAWKYIIPRLNGDFVLYMSQDDLLADNTLEKLMVCQTATNADAVATREFIYHEGVEESKLPVVGEESIIGETMTGPEAFRYTFDHQITGFLMWKTAIVRNGMLLTDTYNADDINQRQWISTCRKVAFCDAPFYYRCDNPNAITKRHSAKQYEDILSFSYLLQVVKDRLPSDTTLHQRLNNQYFDYLLRRMLLFSQKKKLFSDEERKHIRTVFHKSYRILKKGCTLSNWKYKYSRISFHSMWIVTYIKSLQYTLRGIKLDTDIDTGIL